MIETVYGKREVCSNCSRDGCAVRIRLAGARTTRAEGCPGWQHYDVIPRTDILARGWTRGMVDALLGEPDERWPNPHSPTGPAMCMYRYDRVRAAEITEGYALLLTRANQHGRRIGKMMATTKVIPPEPIHFHPAALAEFEALCTEARHVAAVRLKAHLDAAKFGRSGQSIDRCGDIPATNGLPPVHFFRKQTKRYDVRVYFVVLAGSAVVLYVDPSQRRDKRTDGVTASIVARRKELIERKCTTKPISAVRTATLSPKEPVLAHVLPPASPDGADEEPDEEPDEPPLLLRQAPREKPAPAPQPAPAASKAEPPAPEPLRPAEAPVRVQGPALVEAPPAGDVPLTERVRKVLLEFRMDPGGLSPEEVADLLRSKELPLTSGAARGALRNLVEAQRAVAVPGVSPVRYRCGPRVEEALTGIPRRGTVDVVLRALRTLARSVRANPQGATVQDVLGLLTANGVTEFERKHLHGALHDMHESGRVNRTRDEGAGAFRYSLRYTDDLQGAVFEHVPEEKVEKSMPTVPVPVPPVKLPAGWRPPLPNPDRPVDTPPLPSTAPPPPPATGAREQLLRFADAFRRAVGEALASDELREEECEQGLTVLKSIKEYAAKLREGKGT